MFRVHSPIGTGTHASLLKLSITLLLSILLSPLSYADNLGVQINGIYLNFDGSDEGSMLQLCPGISCSYDFRNPSNRSGWSIAPVAANIAARGNNQLLSVFLLGALAKYRYCFKIPAAMEFNIGAASCYLLESSGSGGSNGARMSYEENDQLIYLLPLASLSFNYVFAAGNLVGIQLGAMYAEGVVPVFSCNFSVPIELMSSRRYRHS